MVDFLTLIKNVLEEKNITCEELFADNVVSKDTFYKYRQRYPSLRTLIKLANYLQISIDYLFEITDKNNFKPYSKNQINFYNRLKELLKINKISNRKFCNDLHYSKDNLLRWKNGTEPTVRRLIEIAKYFNCSIDDLLDRT